MNEKKVIIGLLAIIVIFVVGVLLLELQSMLLPLLLSIFLSYLFKPLVVYLKSKRVPTVISLILVLITVSAVIFVLSLVVYSSTTSFIAEAPKYQTKLNELAAQIFALASDVATRFDVKLSEYSWMDAIQFSGTTSFLASSVGTFFTFLSNFFLVLLFMLFILAASGDMTAKIENSFPAEYANRIASIISNIDKQVRQYVLAKTLISLGTGAITTVILAIIGVDFAIFWGFLTFLLNFIPNIGSIISTLFPTLLSFLQFDSFTQPILVIVLLIATQMVMGNVVEPKMMAFSLNLSPLVILVALIFWGWLWGIWGMILAVPMTSILKISCENIDPLRPIAALMSGTIPKPKAAI